MEKISRETAIRLGLKRYFTGAPCIHGHICERLVKKFGGGECVECGRLSQQRHKERNLPRHALLRLGHSVCLRDPYFLCRKRARVMNQFTIGD